MELWGFPWRIVPWRGGSEVGIQVVKFMVKVIKAIVKVIMVMMEVMVISPLSVPRSPPECP